MTHNYHFTLLLALPLDGDTTACFSKTQKKEPTKDTTRKVQNTMLFRSLLT